MCSFSFYLLKQTHIKNATKILNMLTIIIALALYNNWYKTNFLCIIFPLFLDLREVRNNGYLQSSGVSIKSSGSWVDNLRQDKKPRNIISTTYYCLDCFSLLVLSLCVAMWASGLYLLTGAVLFKIPCSCYTNIIWPRLSPQFWKLNEITNYCVSFC